MLLSKVNLEFNGQGADVGMTLNGIATRALQQLIDLGHLSYSDMPRSIISVLKYESKAY